MGWQVLRACLVRREVLQEAPGDCDLGPSLRVVLGHHPLQQMREQVLHLRDARPSEGCAHA